MILGAVKAQNDTKSIISKESIAKRQRVKRDINSVSHKSKYQNEINKLKQSGALRYLPKLSIDMPFMATRIKFVN